MKLISKSKRQILINSLLEYGFHRTEYSNGVIGYHKQVSVELLFKTLGKAKDYTNLEKCKKACLDFAQIEYLENTDTVQWMFGNAVSPDYIWDKYIMNDSKFQLAAGMSLLKTFFIKDENNGTISDQN